MIVLDASVLIAHLETTGAHHTRATELLLDHAAEERGVSSVTLAEVLVAPARHGRLARTVTALDALGRRARHLRRPARAGRGGARGRRHLVTAGGSRRLRRDDWRGWGTTGGS